MRGGVYFLEITRNAKTKRWHPHLHVVWDGAYIPQPVVRQFWQEITGDSYIVDLRLLHDANSALGYIAKYVGKPLPKSVYADQEAVVEYLEAIKGRRVFGTFGRWKGFRLERNPDEQSEWDPVLPLAEIILAARAGDESAKLIMWRLRNVSEKNSLDLERGPPEDGEEKGASPESGKAPF